MKRRKKVLPILSDKVLVARVLNGDSEAVSMLHDRYRDKVRGLSVRIGYANCWEDDIEQSAWMHIFTRLHQWKGKAALSSWIYRIVANEGFLKYRKERRWLNGAVSYEGRDFADGRNRQDRVLYNIQILRSVEQKLRCMDPNWSSILVAQDIFGFENPETAAINNISIPAVKSRLFRARRKLRKSILATSIKDVVNY